MSPFAPRKDAIVTRSVSEEFECSLAEVLADASGFYKFTTYPRKDVFVIQSVSEDLNPARFDFLVNASDDQDSSAGTR